MYKVFLIIITLATFAMGQSDSLKTQASNAGSSAITTGKLIVVTTVSGVQTVVETSKTVIVASKEIYNSKACQQGIETSKNLISKGWNFLKAVIDSTGGKK